MTQQDGVPTCARILVVDDDVDTAEMLQELLQDSGHDVCIAHDGISALRQAESFRPDVVFLDLTLPVMDGYEICRRLVLLAGKAPRIFAVSGQPHLDGDRLREAGFTGVLPKPAVWERIRELVGVGHA